MTNGWGPRHAVARALLAGMALWVGCGPGPAEAPEAELPLARVEQRHEHDVRTRWVRRSVGQPERYVFSEGVTTDRDEASTLVGSYQGAPDFGSGPLPPMDITFGLSAFIVKYARDGRLLWAHGYGAPAGSLFPTVSFSKVVADRERNLTVYGSTLQGMSLGGFSVEPGSFLVQFSSKGEVRWVRSLRGTLSVTHGLAVDRDDNILLAGSMFGTADFGGGPRTASPDGAFFAKYTQGGGYQLDRVFDSSATSHFHSVAVDEHGQLYLAGTFYEASDFGGGLLLPVSPGVETAVVARYNPSGAHVWSRTLKGITGSSAFRDIAVHGNRVVVVGEFSGRFRFDGRTFKAPGGDNSGLVLAMTRDGEDRWGRRLDGNVLEVESDLEDTMTVYGTASPGDDVGTGPLPQGGSYSHISRFARVDGDREWVRVFDTFGAVITGLSVARHGEVTAAGSFLFPVDFGTGTLVPSNPGTYDAFIFRMEP